MTMTRKWSLLAVIVVVAVFVASWFLLIAPKRGEVSDLKAQSVTQESKNQALVQQLNQLKAQSQDLPKQKAQLAVFRTQVPDNPALPSMIRDLSSAAKKSGAELDSIEPADPSPVVVSTTPVAPTATTGSSGDGSTSTESTTTPAAPAAPTSTLYQVPVKLTLTGSYFELEQFINKLEGMRRSLLVTGFSLVEASGAATSGTASGSSTESTTTPGDLTLSLDGRVFLAPATTAAASTTTPVASGASSTTAQ